MNDHRVHANLLHQNDIAGKAFHRFIAAHGVSTEFDDDCCAVIALEIRQSLRKRAGGGNPVSVHGVLFLHDSILEC